MTDEILRDEHDENDQNEGLDLGLWKRLFRYTRPYRREVWLLGAAAVVTAGLDAAFPLLTGQVIDDVTAGTATSLAPYVIAYLGLTLAICFCVWSFIYLAGKIRTHIGHDIRKDGFARLQQLSFSYYDKRPVGWLMARMTSDCERLSNILAWGLLDFFWSVTLLVAITAVMVWIDFQMALVVLAVIPVLGWVSASFRKRILRSSRKVRKTNSRITASYNECIMGARTTKVFVRESENLVEFRGLTSAMYGASVKNALQSALYLPIVMALGSVATGAALAVGGLEVTAGRLTIGTLVMFLTYTRQFFDPIHNMAHWFAEMQMAQASAERILGLIAEQPEIQDSPRVRAAIQAAAGTPRPGVAEDGGRDEIGAVEFDRVSFAYGEGAPVLQDFVLKVNEGETIALVGSTGGGKTTIVSLLCRFYEPTSGRILLDGVDYTERGLHWLQSNLGIVLQAPHLFSGSVADNIRYGNLNATDAEVEDVSRLVGAHAFVAAMESGYSTEVGEGGVRLSTGQKQLLSFARAILARPQILVMDEATSSVDSETETEIQRGLAQVLKGRTSFVIAHRLSTIRSADRILVIEQGRIAEQGSHADLMELHGRYYELYTQQSLVNSVRDGVAWT